MRFSNYYNHEGGNRNIYSRRNLLGMTMKEILERELELAYQYNTIGIPDDEELMNSQNAYQYDDNGVQRWSSGQKTPEQMLAEQQKRIQESQAQNLADQNALNAMNTYTNNNLQGFAEPIQNALPKPIANHNLNTDSNYLVKNITDGIQTFNNLNMKNFSNKNLDDSKKSTGGIVAETPEEIEESIMPKVNTKLELTEAEKEEARLKAFEDALDRHYNLDKNGKPLPTGNEEPYLSYEELLGLEPLDTEMDKTQDLYNAPEEVENKPLEATIIKDNILTTYNDEIDNNPNLSEEEKFAKKLEIAQILENSKANLKEIEKEHLKAQAKNFGKAALDIASMIPVAGGVGLIAKGSGAMAKKLVPTLGRKISQIMGKGMKNGAISGATEGAIRGYLEDENPAITAAQDMAIGTALGTAGSAIGGNIEKAVRGKRLKDINDLKFLRKKETEFYKDYIQKTKTKHPNIGNIEFTQAGLETVSKQPNAARDFNSLKKELKSAKHVGYETPYHIKHGTKDNIKGFYRLRNGNKEFLIADTSDGAKYYMSKQIGELGNRPSRVEPNSPTNIITNTSTNLNPQVANQTIQAPKTYQDWLDWLRKKRRKR